MNALCASKQEHGGAKPRAAETGEILARSIANMPDINSAEVPVMGTCPGCEGEKDSEDSDTHASKHSRICWDPKESLNSAQARYTCNQGKKAVMCVLEAAVGDGHTVHPPFGGQMWEHG